MKRERELGYEFAALFYRRAIPRGDHDEITDPDVVFPDHGAVCLADDPFGPVADDRPPDLLRYGEPDPVDPDLLGMLFLEPLRRVVGEQVDREGGGHESLAFRVRF